MAMSNHNRHRGATSSTSSGGFSPELYEKIAVRAYYLYQSRGAAEGHDLDDWLQAEAEIKNELREGRALKAVRSGAA